MLFLGSFRARLARRWWYSRAEMPGVTATRCYGQRIDYVGYDADVQSPGLMMCGCVSCNGCPNCMSAADTSSAIPLLACHWICHGSCAKTGLLLNRGTGRNAARNADGMFLFISSEEETDERYLQDSLRSRKRTCTPSVGPPPPQPHTETNFPIGICTWTDQATTCKCCARRDR